MKNNSLLKRNIAIKCFRDAHVCYNPSHMKMFEIKTCPFSYFMLFVLKDNVLSAFKVERLNLLQRNPTES